MKWDVDFISIILISFYWSRVLLIVSCLSACVLFIVLFFVIIDLTNGCRKYAFRNSIETNLLYSADVIFRKHQSLPHHNNPRLLL